MIDDQETMRYPRTMRELTDRIRERERRAAVAERRTILLHCISGQCNGGAHPCPTPQACVVANEPSERAARRGMACVVVVVAACVAIAAASVFMLHATGGA